MNSQRGVNFNRSNRRRRNNRNRNENINRPLRRNENIFSEKAYDRVYPVGICVTTRSIGFGVIRMTKSMGFFKLFNKNLINIYDMYRYGLFLFELRLRSIHERVKDFNVPMNSADLFDVLGNENYLQLLPHDFGNVFMYSIQRRLPYELAIPLNALGLVQHNNKLYIPQIGKKNYENGKFIPQSEQILLSTLRETVVALSEIETPREYRKKFYENNPIPGCIWEGAPENPRLKNANEIMPNTYKYSTCNRLQISFCAVKEPYLENFKGFTDMTGSKALLVCNNQNGMRVADRKNGEDLTTYYSKHNRKGDIEDFEYLEPLTKEIQEEGCFSILGERPALEILEYKPAYLNRHKNLCQQLGNNNYFNAFNHFNSLVSKKITEYYRNNPDSSDSSD